MKLVLVLVLIAAVAAVLYVAVSAWLTARRDRRARWRQKTVTRPDGTLAVLVGRDGNEHSRTVLELAPGMDPLEFASELRLAREQAQLLADELNRPP